MDEDPQIAAAGKAETSPVPDVDALRLKSEGGPSIPVPSDSTEPLLVQNVRDEKDILFDLLTARQVSVTEITYEGRRHRLYLGKPSMLVFENMLRRSKGDGILIEPDPRVEGVEHAMWKERAA